MRRTFIQRCIGAFLLAALIFSGCAPAPAAATPKLRVTVMPVLDSIPIYVAQQEGYFTQHGIEVEIIPVASAPERDQLITAGQADGMVNEVLSTLFYNQERVKVQVVRIARSAEQGYPLFSIVAAGDSGIESPDQLKGVPIGVSDGTVIAYLTDRLLEHEGLAGGEIATMAVPNIRDRMTLLNSGELPAGTLPEPLTSLAVMQGARVIVEDTRYPEISFSTISFRKEVLDQQPDAVRAFLAAVEDAVNAINADRTRWQALLAEYSLVPEPLLENYVLPEFGTAVVPTEAQYLDVVDWAESEGLIGNRVPYRDSVNAGFLPQVDGR